MSDGTYRGRWMDEICGTPHVSPEVKVLLLTMARWMDDSGFVSVPREQLAALLKCAPRNITAKQTAACAAKLLERVGGGHRGRTAEFQALVPGITPPERVMTVVTQSAGKGDDDYHPLDGPKGDDDYHPFQRKGDDSHHPIAEKGGRLSSPHMYTHTEDDDHDTAVVVDLFDEKTTTRKEHTLVRATRADSPDFAAFWAVYPRKVAKGGARKAWDKAIKNGADPAEIVLGARRYNSDPRRSTADIRYTAHPATWLNQERWTDEAEPAPAAHVPAPLDRRQQATNDLFGRAMERARARDAQEGRR